MTTETTDQAGKVVVVIGEVTAESSSGSRILAVDGPIFQDDVLITEQDERIEVLFNDGTRLSQGENSRLNIDSYVYDPADVDSSEILLNAVQGTFRTITGKIADENPDNFSIQSPLATLGIRGTTVLSHITPEHEIHGPEFIEEGKAFVLTDSFGNIRFITDHVPVKVIDLRPDEPAGFQRMLSEDELNFFDQQVLMSPEIEDDSPTTGLEAAAAAFAPFGFGDVETIADQHQALTPSLFGPEGLHPSQVLQTTGPVSAYDLFSPQDGMLGTLDDPEDMLGGKVQDSSYHTFPPEAENKAGTINEDSPYTGRLSAASNDADHLVFTALSEPQHGSLTLNPDGTYVYQPDPNFFGDDGFTYQVVDSFGNTSSATVTIQVDPVNDVPVAQNATFSTHSPATGQVHATDVDGDPLSFSIDTGPLHGEVTMNPDGSFVYNPNPDFIGTDSFIFGVSDGQGGYDTGVATIEVGGEPTPAPTPAHTPTPTPSGEIWYGDMWPTAAFPSPVADTHTGTPYNDFLYGLDLQDILDGGAGNDQIEGGQGPDELTGGPGSDTFVYLNGADLGEGGDFITDFQTGSDKIQITSSSAQVITVTATSYTGIAPGTGPAIILFHKTTPTSAGTTHWEVLYDPSVSSTAFSHVQITDLGTSPIDSGDIVLITA